MDARQTLTGQIRSRAYLTGINTKETNKDWIANRIHPIAVDVSGAFTDQGGSNV